MIYDYIIVGGGIAGLYSAYNLKSKSFIILEANKKKNFGGRLHQELFSNHLINTGAGVGRDKKDKYLKKLLNELNIKYFKFKKQVDHTFEPVDTINILKLLKKKFIEMKKPRKTFKDFALPILGSDKYNQLIDTLGYSDYENDDVEHALYMYGFDDLTSPWTGLSIPWNILIEKLINKVGSDNIKTNSKVIKIKSDDLISVYTETKEYIGRKVIVATTIESLRKLFKNPIYNYIEGQPFIRIYGTVTKKYIPIMKEKINGTLIVNNELQKIIAINPDKGLYMIAYADNKDAIKLKNHIDKEYLENLIKKALDIDEIKLSKIVNYYRDIGTHYYKPMPNNFKSREEFIKQAQNPDNNIFVIGEVVSENQGWTNSALGTYHKIKKYL
jgi:hypothetical protein